MPICSARRLCLAAVSVAAMGIPARLAAQATAFEAASVKPNRSASSSGMRMSRYPNLRNGTFHAENVSLKTLLGVAYGVQTSRIAGPDWIDSDGFDIVAKAPEGVPDSQLMPLLQSLLKDRFLVTVHRETKEMAALDMVAAKDGVKIHPRDTEHPPVMPHFAGGAMMAGNATMPEIADALARVAGRPVVDKTGLEGIFFYNLNYAPLSAQPVESDSGPPDFFAAVQQQMGLKLEPKKEPIEILVMDHAERAPTEN